ncbi:MAG TPA: hypothetical protein VHZ78_14825 [Rhizomicrobium sp.]|nr:hypothetical protein [Rhizomicrobium sp.]
MSDAAPRKVKLGAVLAAILRVLADRSFLVQALPIPFAMMFAAEWVLHAIPSTIVAFAALIAIAIAGASLAVRTHRHILLHENPSATSLGGPEWSYLGRVFVLYLPVFASALGFFALYVLFAGRAFIASPTSHPIWELYAVPVFIFVVVPLLVGGLILPAMLALPALAIGRDQFGEKDSRAAVKGNRLRILALAAIVWLVPEIPIFALAWVAGQFIAASIVAIALLDAIAAALGGILFAALLSIVYAGLVEEKPEFTG